MWVYETVWQITMQCTTLTLLLDRRRVDGERRLSRRLLRVDDLPAEAPRQLCRTGGVQIEGGARLHDWPRRAGPDGDAVRLCVVPGQVRLHLELFATIDHRASGRKQGDCIDLVDLVVSCLH